MGGVSVADGVQQCPMSQPSEPNAHAATLVWKPLRQHAPRAPQKCGQSPAAPHCDQQKLPVRMTIRSCSRPLSVQYSIDRAVLPGRRGSAGCEHTAVRKSSQSDLITRDTCTCTCHHHSRSRAPARLEAQRCPSPSDESTRFGLLPGRLFRPPCTHPRRCCETHALALYHVPTPATSKRTIPYTRTQNVPKVSLRSNFDHGGC